MSELLQSEIERVGASWTTLDQVVRSLSDEELTVPQKDRWSIKDHLAHVALAERFCSAAFLDRPLHESLGMEKDAFLRSSEDEINEFGYQLYKSTSLPEVMALCQETHRELVNTLAGLSEADLQKPFAPYGSEPTGTSMLDVLKGNTYDHYDVHRGWIETIVNQSES